MKTPQKIFLDWDEIEVLIDTLCNKIVIDLPHIETVTGISRGGLIPAVWISHKLSLPYVHTISPNTLVIDDISDTGLTIKDHAGIYFATLLHKPTACCAPNVYGELHKGNEWIVFAWENVHSKPIQDYLKNKEK